MDKLRLHPLAREIGVILVIKVIALISIHSMFFADADDLDAGQVDTHLLSAKER